MKSLAPPIFCKAPSSGLNWMATHVNSLASTFAALELGKQNISIGRMIPSELLTSLLQIQPARVVAVHAENIELHAVLNAAANGCVWPINLHDDSYYTVNETKTNHNLRGQIE